MNESDIQREILGAISRGRGRFWRQQSGKVCVVDVERAKRAGIPFRFMELAPPGAADLTGIYDDGRRVEVEVKAARGKQNPDQIAWQNMVRSRGGVYVLARSVPEAVQKLVDAGCPL